jgi:hypothetical protein
MSSSRRPAMWRTPQVWLIIAAIIVLPFLAEFNARLAQSRELDAQQAALSAQLDAENARHEALLKLQVWVNSDGYVEHWARLARMVQPGEIAVVPVASQLTSSTSTTQSAAGNAAPNDILGEWWAAFFGEAR